MERRPRTQRRRATGRLTTPPAGASFPWPNIEALVECEGQVSLGRIGPISLAAVASGEHNMLAQLVRRDGESLMDLLQRLDEAIDKAVNEETYTDEINEPRPGRGRSR